ncbi:MAG: HIT family protein [Candidatus Doudnabacteria bacterium]
MTDCIFCKIVNKEIPADIIYEDDRTLAFMDIRPVSRGHVLVIPKLHSEDLLSTDDETLRDLIPKIKIIATAVMNAVDADGINLTTNHGAAAGQVIFHMHFHLIPRYKNDGLKPWQHHDSEPKTRAELAVLIKNNL